MNNDSVNMKMTNKNISCNDHNVDQVTFDSCQGYEKKKKNLSIEQVITYNNVIALI